MNKSSVSAPNLGPTQTKYSDASALFAIANRRFFRALKELIRAVPAGTVLDAGCGEGEVLDRLGFLTATGVDLDPERSQLAHERLTKARIGTADIHNLPFPEASFDLVLMLEVLEHVGDPQAALSEARRVTRRYLLASVPNEPWWRIGNMMRLKYVRDFGNTPEHINHWTAGRFRDFISGQFKILHVRRPFLWTFILAEKLT